jgi:hypothetical protein
MSAVNTFGLPLSAPSLTLTDAAGLVTDAVTADAVITPLVRSASPTAGTGAAGVDLQIVASSGATSAGAAGGVGGDLELFAGAAGDGVGDANGGSVILRSGLADGSGFSGLVRVQNGPLVRQCSLRDKGAAGASLSVGDLRGALIFGANASGGNVNYALPAADVIVQGFPGIQQNDTIFFSVVNKGIGLNTVTITLPAGSASQGSVVVAVSSSASFALIMTNVSAGTEAFTLYRMS